MEKTSGVPATFSTPLLMACFFGSGLTGLAYELVWTRRLQLVFGSTTYSVSTVLAAFMAGLGFGSYLVGRWVDRHPEKGIQTYAWLELGVAGYALISLPLIGGVEALYAVLQRSLELGQAGSTVLRFLLAFPVLALPAGMMGGTLPALVRGLTSERRMLPQQIGLLYGINTAGAACGTLLTGALAIELLGLWNSVLVAASLNFGIALVVFRHLRGKEQTAAEVVKNEVSAARLRQHLRKPEVLFATVAVVLTGVLSMGYEIVWTRLLSLTMGSSTYAFTIVLGIFLLGIAGGSLLFSRFSRKRQPTSFGLAILLFLLAIWATISLVVIPSLPLLLVEAVQGVELSFARVVIYECCFAGAMLLIPTLILGAALPMAMGIISRAVSQAGRDVGGIYLVNTCGAIAGSLVTGFLLVPWLGTHLTLLIILFANLILAGVGMVLFAGVMPRRLVGMAFSVALGIFIMLQPAWPPVVFDAGLGYRLDRVEGKDRLSMLRKLHRTPNQLLFRREGVNGTITVRHFGDGVSLLVNGKSDASSIDDMTAQVLTGVIPMAVHSKPERIGIVGWGSGVTAYSMGLFPDVKRIDAIEIEKAVIEASPFFHSVNGAAEKDPRVNVIYDDARSHFLTTEEKYDVITSEPSNPWMQGVSGLFSENFYGLVNQRLAKGGVFAQWLQLYRIDIKSVGMVLRTLLDSFPHAQLWYTDHADVMLLASQSPIVVDFARIKRIYAQSGKLREYMGAYGPGAKPEHLLGCYLLDRKSLEKIVEEVSDTTVTDTNPRLEYRAVRNLYGDTQPHIRRLWRAKMTAATVLPATPGAEPAGDIALSGALRLLRGDATFAVEAARWSVERYPKSKPLRLALARALMRHKQPAVALEVLDRLENSIAAQDGKLRADMALIRSRAMGALGNGREAMSMLATMGKHRPTAQHYYRARFATALGQYGQAWESAEKLMGRLDDKADLDARLLRRSRVYSGLLTALMKRSRAYARGIRLLKSAEGRKEGEVQRLLLLLTLQRAVGDHQGAAAALDALQAYNRVERPSRKTCETVYEKAGRSADAYRCVSTL
jgi:spermidine synthase